MATRNKKPAGRRAPEAVLIAVAGIVAFAAVLLYHGPARVHPRDLLRTAKAWTGKSADQLAALVRGSSVAHGTPSVAGGFQSERSAGAAADGASAPGRGGGSGAAWNTNGFGVGSATGGGASGSGAANGSSPGVPQGSATASEVAGGAILPPASGLGGSGAPGRGEPNGAEAQRDKIAQGMAAGGSGGVRVDEVLPSSIAGQLGLQPGDLIVAVNGSPISTPQQLAQIFQQSGLPRQIDAVRGGRAIHLHP